MELWLSEMPSWRRWHLQDWKDLDTQNRERMLYIEITTYGKSCRVKRYMQKAEMARPPGSKGCVLRGIQQPRRLHRGWNQMPGHWKG